MPRLTFEADLTAAPADIDVLVGAVGPERTDELPGVSAQLTRVAPDRARLVLAGDHAAHVRAAVNAYLRWVRTVDDVLRVAGPREVPDG